MTPVAITEAAYLEAVEAYMGFCVGTCKEFTRDMTEPDAEGYNCPMCGEATVMGAEQALIVGQIEIDDEPSQA